MRKLTKEIINLRIKDRDIELVGDYLNSSIKTEFKCLENHTWNAKPNSILNDIGCPYCANINKRFSKEIIVDQLLEDGRGIELIGDYTNNKTKTRFKCLENHIWDASPNSILSGSNCPLCSSTAKLSKKIINERIVKRDIVMIGEYINSRTKTEFQCLENHIWSSMPLNILSGNSCPFCSQHGFNSSKVSWVYILIFDTFIKYGITNNLQRRLKEHLKNGQYTVATTKLYEDGKIAQNWERNIKIIFGGRHVTKEIMPDGYTETLSLDKLDDLLKTIR